MASPCRSTATLGESVAPHPGAETFQGAVHAACAGTETPTVTVSALAVTATPVVSVRRVRNRRPDVIGRLDQRNTDIKCSRGERVTSRTCLQHAECLRPDAGA